MLVNFVVVKRNTSQHINAKISPWSILQTRIVRNDIYRGLRFSCVVELRTRKVQGVVKIQLLPLIATKNGDRTFRAMDALFFGGSQSNEDHVIMLRVPNARSKIFGFLSAKTPQHRKDTFRGKLTNYSPDLTAKREKRSTRCPKSILPVVAARPHIARWMWLQTTLKAVHGAVTHTLGNWTISESV